MNTQEAQQNLRVLTEEISKYQNLSRSMMTRSEMIMVDQKIIVLKERVKNIRSILDS
ncbi:hypothetical protein [Acinetobacter sp. UBA6007]|uniref:hypothetical protein n=1 Tax=Acinetobacter sp. UBA6007 TaxID=1945949 RepID=UPI00257CACBB|nr:hypothetical protein [Acinetobacter sp. UBA6007]